MPMSAGAWLVLACVVGLPLLLVAEGKRQERRYGKGSGRGSALFRAGMLETQRLLEPERKVARAAIERRRELGGFRPIGQVQVAGRPMLGLSLRRRSSDEPRPFPDDGAEWFDRERTSPWAPVGKLYRSESPRRC